MNRHTDQLYPLAELPAFIEEALSNVSLKALIAGFLELSGHKMALAIHEATLQYAEEWVDHWMHNHPEPLYDSSNRDEDPEIRAIEAGVKLFSNPDCKAGLPE